MFVKCFVKVFNSVLVAKHVVKCFVKVFNSALVTNHVVKCFVKVFNSVLVTNHVVKRGQIETYFIPFVSCNIIADRIFQKILFRYFVIQIEGKLILFSCTAFFAVLPHVYSILRYKQRRCTYNHHIEKTHHFLFFCL